MTRNSYNMIRRLESAGFDYSEATTLRRIQMTLHRWAEYECGTGEGQVSRSIERDDETGKPFMRVQYPTAGGYVDNRWPIADRERGALTRLEKIMASHPDYVAYNQSDPRGCALYIVAKRDIGDMDVTANYTRGIAVCD